MPKLDFFRRILIGCFTHTTQAPTSNTTTKKRLSTSLRDDIISTTTTTPSTSDDDDAESTTTTTSALAFAPPRASNARPIVICTFFGPRAGPHVWFSVQLNRLSSKPSLLLQLSLSTKNLVKEMQCGVLRIALECNSSEFSSCSLHSIPVWTMFCNGRPVGFATRRKPNSHIRHLLTKMQSITMGAGVIHADHQTTQTAQEETTDFMYMRANYEWVIGGANSESFHLISPDDCSGQELSVFLLRSH
ncbi:Protein MIZU-KUSSEI 1 [Bienertia sinuspersici]